MCLVRFAAQTQVRACDQLTTVTAWGRLGVYCEVQTVRAASSCCIAFIVTCGLYAHDSACKEGAPGCAGVQQVRRAGLSVVSLGPYSIGPCGLGTRRYVFGLCLWCLVLPARNCSYGLAVCWDLSQYALVQRYQITRTTHSLRGVGCGMPCWLSKWPHRT